MGTAVILISVSVLFGILAYVRSRQPSNKAPYSQPPVKKMKSSWAYQIITPNDPELSCQQAKLIRNKAIPAQSSTGMPRLPLANCDVKVCRCRLEPMSEKRAGKDRRFQEDRRIEIRYQDDNNRRKRKDRRKNNIIWSDRFGKR